MLCASASAGVFGSLNLSLITDICTYVQTDLIEMF